MKNNYILISEFEGELDGKMIYCKNKSGIFFKLGKVKDNKVQAGNIKVELDYEKMYTKI